MVCERTKIWLGSATWVTIPLIRFASRAHHRAGPLSWASWTGSGCGWLAPTPADDAALTRVRTTRPITCEAVRARRRTILSSSGWGSGYGRDNPVFDGMHEASPPWSTGAT